jgi:hypothetical protein
MMELLWLIIMIVIIAYFFGGIDIIEMITGGGKKGSIPDRVFKVVRFVLILFLSVVSVVFFYSWIAGW